MGAIGASSTELISAADTYSAHTYHPLPVVLASGRGAWVTDVAGHRYLDLLAGYSALNFGHGHPRLVAEARAQLSRLTLTSRAFHHEHFAAFCRRLAALCGKEMVLPMNTGAEAVETAVKTARKWGYQVKGVAPGQARIVVADGNFHGRTTTVVSFSTDQEARRDYGPYTPGFTTVPYGDRAALDAAVDDDTVAVLLEPVQGEAGVLIPPEGYLQHAREVTRQRGALLIADEIQSGLGRTGYTLACAHDHVVPDVYVLGKALGGGIVPVSAVVADREVLGVFRPGEHGSTFGGNPLACAVALEVITMLEEGEYQARAERLGLRFRQELDALSAEGLVSAVRSRGLWAGVDLAPTAGGAPDDRDGQEVSGAGRRAAERLLARGVLAKETHGATLRLAPPLVIEEEDLAWGLAQLGAVLRESAADGRGTVRPVGPDRAAGPAADGVDRARGAASGNGTGGVADGPGSGAGPSGAAGVRHPG